MAKKILIASGKGGVGKSTLSAFLGRELSQRDNKVLLVDTDLGLSALDILLNVSEGLVYNWYDAYKGICEVKDAIIQVSSDGNLSLLPAPPLYVNATIQPSEMEALIGGLDDLYDYIIIDAPAGLGEGLLMSSTIADVALVVATPDEISIKGAFALASLLEEKGIDHLRLVINRFRKKEVKKGSLLAYDTAIDKTGVQLIGIVPESPDPNFAFVQKIPPNTRKRTLLAFRRIAARIEGEEVPLGLL